MKLMRQTSMLLAMLGVLTVLGCEEDEMQSREAQALAEGLEAFTAAGPNGASMYLEEAADFAWDDVVFFPSSLSTDQMGQMIGQNVHLGDEIVSQLTSDSTILIFRQGGDVVVQAVIGPPLFLSGTPGRSYRRGDAVLVVHTKDPGPYTSLRFRD